METAFLVCLLIVLYTYAGYGLILFMLATLRKVFFRSYTPEADQGYRPSLSVIVAAYNEALCIEEKIRNCLTLEYPAERCRFIFVTDGSTDETAAIVARYPQIHLLHRPERQGKAAAIHRAMQLADTELVVFTDANTLLNSDALLHISRHYSDPHTGAVAGEKKVLASVSGATAGEGWYWRYESMLKRWESEVYSVMGAAGELFSIRRELYRQPPVDTVLDDFVLSSSVALKGYRVRYDPAAIAAEPASRSISEEWKRKVRIAAGGIQMITRSRKYLSLRRPLFCFEYISHRVLRWVVAPYLLIAVFGINMAWVLTHGSEGCMFFLLIAQLLWYAVSITGWLVQAGGIRAGWLFAPFYFCMMNAAMIAGLFRFISGRQTVLWEKSRR